MRMEGLEEPGGDPTGWHENRRGCQLAGVSGLGETLAEGETDP